MSDVDEDPEVVDEVDGSPPVVVSVGLELVDDVVVVPLVSSPPVLGPVLCSPTPGTQAPPRFPGFPGA